MNIPMTPSLADAIGEAVAEALRKHIPDPAQPEDGPVPRGHAHRLGDICIALDLPESTMRQLIREGRGPKTFALGRRTYVRHDDYVEWFAQRAAEEGGAQ